MRQYLVIAHKTLGGPHLMEHLHHLREADANCRFHVVVPVHHPPDHAWTEGEVEATAAAALDEMMDRMAAMGMGATGEVGDSNPVYAAEVAIRHLDAAPAAIVVSTLPRGISRWWRFDVPKRLKEAYPDTTVTHLASEEVLVS